MHAEEWSNGPSGRPRRRRMPSRAKADGVYRVWVESVLEQEPTRWAGGEAELTHEFQALARLSGMVPGEALAQAFTTAPVPRASDEAVLELISCADRLMSWLGSRQLDLVTELIARREGTCSAAYVTEELAAQLSLTGYAADRLAWRAERLNEFPEVAQGLRAGRIDVRKADILIEGTQSLPCLQARAVHRRVLPLAEQLTTAQLRKSVAAAVIAVDPTLAQERHERATEARTVTLSPAADGMAWLSAYLPAPQAMSAFGAIDDAAKPRGGDADERSAGARRADAMVSLLRRDRRSATADGGTEGTGRAAAEGAGENGVHNAGDQDVSWAGAGGHGLAGDGVAGRPVHLMLTMPLSSFEGSSNAPAHLAGYGPITPESARVLAEAADRHTTLVTNPDTGHLEGIERHGRTRSRSERRMSRRERRAMKRAAAAAAGGGSEASESADTRDSDDSDSSKVRAPDTRDADFRAIDGSRASPSSPDVAAPIPGFASLREGGTRDGDRAASACDGDSAAAMHDAQALIDHVCRAGSADPVRSLREDLGLLSSDAYRPGAELRDYILARDGTCRFPGCEQRASRCQVDHIVPFTDALPAWCQTVQWNLHLLCTRHHQMKTHGGWRVSRAGDGSTEWISPAGRVFRRPAQVVDTSIEGRSYADCLEELVGILGDDAEALRGQPLIDPGTGEDLVPGNVAHDEVAAIRNRLMGAVEAASSGGPLDHESAARAPQPDITSPPGDPPF